MKTSRFLIVVSTIALSTSVQAQSEAAKAPAPPVQTAKRRSFDQFDVPGGVSLPAARPTSPAEPATPVAVESVDADTYDGVTRMIDYAAAVEKEYRANAADGQDQSDYYSADNVLMRKLAAVYRLTEMFRTGILGNRLTQESNLNLLKANREILNDILATMKVMSNGNALTDDEAKKLAARYGAAPEKQVSRETLVKAMLAKMNGNFNRLKAGISTGEK